MANEANAALGSSKLFPGLKTPDSQGPAMPKAVSGGLSEDSKNVFTELFGNDVSQKNGSMMNTVVAQSDKKGISYFGDKPKSPDLSLKKFSKHSARPGSAVLKAAVLILCVTVFGFSTQTQTKLSLFGVNPALRLETVQGQVDKSQAEITVQKNLAASLLLDQFSDAADKYLYNQSQVESEYTSTNKREEYQATAEKLKSTLVDLLGQVQTNFEGDLTPEDSALAIQVANNLIGALQAQSGSVDEQSLQQEIRDIQTTVALLGNSGFRAMVLSLDPSTISDEEIQAVLQDFSMMNASLTATINSIQSSRVNWSIYLDEIDSITKSVDPLFGTEFQSSLTISDVILKEDGSVSISGDTNTDDSKAFTLISNLVDAFEASDDFMDVQERSFSKSEGDTSYSSSFRISMTLQTNPENNE